MADDTSNAEERPSRRLLLIAVVLVLIAVGAYFAFIGASVREDSLREDMLELIRKRVQATENERVLWTPGFAGEKYKLGAVFIENRYVEAESIRCYGLPSEEQDRQQTLTADGIYEIGPNTTLTPGADRLGVTGASGALAAGSSVSYELQIEKVSSTTARDDRLDAIYKNPDCLATVANRPVLLLFMILAGREVYRLESSLSGKGEAQLTSGATGGVDGRLVEGRTFEDKEARPVVWGLMQLEISSDRLPADAPFDFRKRAATELMENEGPAIELLRANTVVEQPDDEDVSALFDLLK